MDKNIISVDEFSLKSNLEKGICPLNWLSEYYREYPGKLVMLDKNLLSFLLNKSNCDRIEATEHDGFKQSFTITWNATEEYPETKVVVVSYGRDNIEINEDYSVESDSNYYVIEELYAEDILINGEQYAKNLKSDRQIIFLVSKDLKEEKEINKQGDIL